MRQPNQSMFDRVVQAFRDVDVGSGEIYAAAVSFIDQGAHALARSLLAHAFDMHEEGEGSYMDGERTEAEVYLETFRRAFYDEDTAAWHGTGTVAYSTPLLESITSFLISRAQIGGEELEPESLGENVLRFPGSRSVH